MHTHLIIEPFHFCETDLSGSFIIEPTIREDIRGWFFRSFDEVAFSKAGLNTHWPQINHSFTKLKGCIRGMHFQYPPYSEIKMLRCIAGAVQDVIIDLRSGSSTFLQHFSVMLSASNKKTLYIPKGFAHGFQALENNSELVYHHSDNYVPASEGGILYNDPKTAIKWALPVSVISSRDAAHPLIANDFTGIKI